MLLVAQSVYGCVRQNEQCNIGVLMDSERETHAFWENMCVSPDAASGTVLTTCDVLWNPKP